MALGQEEGGGRMKGWSTRPRPESERLWEKVNKSGPRAPHMESQCWLWLGSLRNGYGAVRVNGRLVRAHRLAFELIRGPIQDGLFLDHLCRVRCCVNPAHLEPVTLRTNNLRGNGASGINARKTHCLRGHPLEGDHVYRRPDRTGRECRVCRRHRAAARASTMSGTT